MNTGMSRGEHRITVRGDRPRIALIRLGAMGDCVYTFPLVSALKARFPQAEVTWIVEAQNQEIPRLHEKPLTRVGQPHTRLRSDENGNSQKILQAANGETHRRLTHPQTFRRPGNI